VSLAISELRVSFDTDETVVRALRGVNLEVAQGEMVGLVGETGCGKSVTGLAVLGLVTPPGRIDGGSIALDGEDLLAKTAEEMRAVRGRRIGTIFQDPAAALNPVFRIGRQLEMVLRAHDVVAPRDIPERIASLLTDVGLSESERVARSYPHQLSGGMQQRAVIAMALACDPTLVIADEPTTALDVTIQNQILDLLVELKRRRGLAVLLITHDLAVVAETCDRVAVLYAGRVVEEGPTAGLLSDPKHPYTQGILAALPSPDRRHEGLVAIPGTVPTGAEEVTGCSFAPRCPHVFERCRTIDPPPFRVGPDRRAECLLYEGASSGN
jgi:oligopeptide/dipeptide ABC transporter ATP-binding protein